MSKKRFRLTMENREKLEGLFFISPFLIGLVLFFIYPVVFSLRLSFGRVTNYVGFVVEGFDFENFTKAFYFDVNFIPTFIDVVKMSLIQAPLIIVFALLIAVLINRKIAGRGFFRVVFFIPFLLGTGEVMNQLLNQGVDRAVLSISSGRLIPYEILNYFGAKVVTSVEDVFGILVTILWSSGVQILLFLGGLQGIAPALYESAKIDGATEWEMLWKITIPIISPITLLCIIYTIADSFATMKNPMLVYIQTVVKEGEFAYAAAMGWIYFAFIILLIGIVFGLMKAYINANQQ